MPRLQTCSPPASQLADLAEVLASLEAAGIRCLVYGGWAEDLLELRAPGPHRDIDLVHPGDSFATVDLAFQRRRLPEEIRAKRFPHKRAFGWHGVCCEILMIQDWRARPVTWQAPIAHRPTVIRAGHHFNVVSAANLRLYRARHRGVEPWRWRTFPAAR